MPILLEAQGAGWKVEVIGKLPDLPPFITIMPQSFIVASGQISLLTLDKKSQKMIRTVSGQLIEPLFFEAVEYDIHLGGCRTQGF